MCIVSNLILPDQYLGISVPGQMFSDEYDKRAIDRTYLSTGLLGGGAVTSPLIPWNTCGIYCMSILGVGALAYAPYAFFDIAMVVVTVVWGFFVAHKVKAEAPFVAKEAASEASLARDEEQPCLQRDDRSHCRAGGRELFGIITNNGGPLFPGARAF